MNRGSVSSGRAAATAGIEALGVADGEDGAGIAAAAAIIVSASASDRAIGFSTSTGDARREKRQRDVTVQLGRHGDRHRVDPAEELAESMSGVVRCAAAISSARGPIDVDDRDELDARQRRQNPGVMAAEMADADDGDRTDITACIAKTCRRRVGSTGLLLGSTLPRDFVFGAGGHGSDRPPDDGDPGFVGRRDDRLAVDHQRLAGIDRQRGRAGGLHRLNRRHADDRHVEPHVLVRLGHLDDAHARARRAARRARSPRRSPPSLRRRRRPRT